MDLVELLDNSDNDSDFKFEDEDWYHTDSDTDEDIPDPNLLLDPLFQDVDKLPEPLKKNHFEEGLLYAMTKCKDKKTMNIILIILVKRRTFFSGCSLPKELTGRHFMKAGKMKNYDTAMCGDWHHAGS